ncbi:MAG TPA: hypothetical protein VKS21_09630 [Spirochaetota bacterium]|nr:hypothetical protein [Spirochaetota bacterium]
MARKKAVLNINIDKEKLEADLDYMSAGLETIIQEDNTGTLNSFSNNNKNDKGFLIDKKSFKKLLNKHNILYDNLKLPEFFYIYIKFSPIVLFKRWIFIISNKDLLKVSQRAHIYEKEFYLLKIKDSFKFIDIVSNIAHEKFLVTLFQRKNIPETTYKFRTSFNKKKELAIYKDYFKSKTSSIVLKQRLEPEKSHDIAVSVIKDANLIKYRISVNRGKKINCSIRVSKSKSKTTIKKSVISDFKSIADYRNEAESIIKQAAGKKLKTNKFANISLGRVNRIPILINLSSKYKNIPISFKISANDQLDIFNEKKVPIKSFRVASNPKSNWLERIS